MNDAHRAENTPFNLRTDRRLLRELQRRHRLTYLFISHDRRVVRALADEILVMRDGVVVEHGPAARIFDEPKDPYTRALMAAAFDLLAGEGIAEAPPCDDPSDTEPC